VIRFWFVGTHYRNPISFGEEELTTAAKGLERLENARFNWEHLLKQATTSGTLSQDVLQNITTMIDQTRTDFIAAMEDDFNTPQALAAIYDLVREINRWVQGSDFKLNREAHGLLQEALNRLLELGGLLGLFIEEKTAGNKLGEPEIEEFITRRTQAKLEKNWALADQIRNQLKEKGIILEDTPQGVRWKYE
jgi:cysteinyl-tRNA synthetase